MVLILTLTLLQTSLQQDPSHDGPGAEEHRRGSDVVKERADYDSSSEQEISSALSSVAQVLGSVRPKKARRHRQRLLLTTAKKLLVSLELFIRRATTPLSWKCVVIRHAIGKRMKKSWIAPTSDVKTKTRGNLVKFICLVICLKRLSRSITPGHLAGVVDGGLVVRTLRCMPFVLSVRRVLSRSGCKPMMARNTYRKIRSVLRDRI